MTDIGQIERKSQNRIIRFFQEELGYDYLGNWGSRKHNSNVEAELLHRHLRKQGYKNELAQMAIDKLSRAAKSEAADLYETNKQIYEILRYGTSIKLAKGKNAQSVQFIDWDNPANNHYAIAEEVSVQGQYAKRPDIVLYLNGIAVGVLELKRSTVSVNKGIRQNIDNQKAEFMQWFFNTMQLIMAGTDTAGMRYGTVGTPEKYYQRWKEDSDREWDTILDKHLFQMCRKERLTELIHDFIVFDSGDKIICRPHQYFGVKAAQEYIRLRKSGIIWHTQGSGKSLTMVFLAQWIQENIRDSRILIITDRVELDKQIVKVFQDANKHISRATSSADLIDKLNSYEHGMVSSLVHKFRGSDDEDYGDYIDNLKGSLPEGFEPRGEFFVFVDECHRTQSGKLHEAMKSILPDATYIGFTGTPILSSEKKTSHEIFGPFIHSYRFDEAVADNVVLDLQYEARDINQAMEDERSVDEWFEAETRGLTDRARQKVMSRWGTLKKLYSSKERLKQVVKDILMDFKTEKRLSTGQGNAILVAGSIYEACKYYNLFQSTELADHCAVVTSYNPSITDIKGESTGSGKTEKQFKYDVYMEMLDGKSPEQYEKEVTDKFKKQPARMKLLIVVDKLLTGFDAPPATYLYIDKSMKDHGLFQAICRVNRLDGESKDYGYIIDYKDLFKSLEKSIQDYTSEAFEDYDKADVDGLLKNRYDEAKLDLDIALDKVEALCEPIYPRESKYFVRYFCGDPENPEDIEITREKREAFYAMTSSLIRKYANIAGEMDKAGYSPKEAERIKSKVKFYTDARDEVLQASNDFIDLKAYEPGMRQLIDLYIGADPSTTIIDFGKYTLVDLLVKHGKNGIDELTESGTKDREAVAEKIENSIRSVINDERAGNPAYFDKMSDLLAELIRQRKQGAIEYEQYLKEKLVELSRKVSKKDLKTYPRSIDTPAKQALYDNLDKDEELVQGLAKVVRESALDGFRDDKVKKRKLRNAVKGYLPQDDKLDMVMDIIINQKDAY